MISKLVQSTALALAMLAPSFAVGESGGRAAPPEVRGTWLTTTANDAIATPTKTAETMAKLREIGLNTVYVECWKNGYTQFPSAVLKKVIGVDRRPALMKQDPSEGDPKSDTGRDLLGETLAAARANNLVFIAWFEYGFMAANKETDNHLRRMKKEWLSLDVKGNEVAPNGFVWMNPLHPEARRFLLDLVLEAVDKYDLDGVQLDDRIVWPHVTMGYDEFTRAVYANEHGGAQPPADHTDAAWVRWRADKVNEYARQFVAEVRRKRPGLIISLSPAVYPWVYDNYCLEWPAWAAWNEGLPVSTGAPVAGDGSAGLLRWDEFVPQCYRMNYKAFEATWFEQIKWVNKMGSGRIKDMHAGIRVVGDGPNATFEEVKKSIELVRSTGGGGHVLWFSRGVLDVYPVELKGLYDVTGQGHAKHPQQDALEKSRRKAPK